MRPVAVIAHRGASGEFPENTIPAFQAAIDLEVEMIEFDVQLTRDHGLIVLHDAGVDRTSDGTGTVADMDLSQIRQLDAGSWFSDHFAGERFPTLKETLGMMPGEMRRLIDCGVDGMLTNYPRRLLELRGRSEVGLASPNTEEAQ